jgi:hypothetical protein
MATALPAASTGESRRLRTARVPSDFWLLVPVLVLVLTVHAAVVTDGFRLSVFVPDGPSHYFDAYADSLRAGRLDVDPYHIGNEAFLLDDRTYGYWGVTPALLRIPLHVVFPQSWGHWSRVFMLLSAALTLLGAHALASTARALDLTPAPRAATGELRFAHVTFLLAVGLGSSALFLPSRPNVYHEATAMGAALAVCGYAAIAAYLRRPSLRRAGLACGLGLLALHARVVAGAGVVVSLVLVVALIVWRARVAAPAGQDPNSSTNAGEPRASPAHALALIVGLLVTVTSYVTINALKFGTVLSIPIERNLQSDPTRLARTGGAMMSPAHILANVYNHLMPWNVRLGSGERLIEPVPPQALLVLSGTDYDWREPIVSLTAASPALVMLAVLGTYALFRALRRREPAARWFPLLIGSAAQASVPLVYFAITQRYIHDMLPLLVVAGALALGHAQRVGASGRRPLLLGLGLLTCCSVLVWWQVGENYRRWAEDTRISPVRADIIVPAYERELRLQPDNATLHAELGLIHQQAGRLAQARPHLERAISLDPDDVQSLVLLAAQRRATDPNAASRLLQQAVQIEAKSAQLRVMLGESLLATGRAQEALEQLRTAVGLDPDDPRARSLLARALAASTPGSGDGASR